MAPYVPALNVVQVALNYTWRGLTAINTLYFQESSGDGWTVPDMTTLASKIVDWHGTEIAPFQGNECALLSVKVTDLTTNISPAVTYTTGLPRAGDHTDNTVQNNQALCVTFNSNGRGRSSHGRNYIPGLRRANLVENTWDQLVADSLALAYEQIRIGEEFDTYNWVILSRTSGGVSRPTGFVFDVADVTITDYTVATMRDRLH